MTTFEITIKFFAIVGLFAIAIGIGFLAAWLNFKIEDRDRKRRLAEQSKP
jgi:hypothetical protein